MWRKGLEFSHWPTLCEACYWIFKRQGTLERGNNKPLASSARRCAFIGRDKPDESRDFLLHSGIWIEHVPRSPYAKRLSWPTGCTMENMCGISRP